MLIIWVSALPLLCSSRNILRRQVDLPRFLAFRLTFFILFTPFLGSLWRGRLAFNKTWMLLWVSAEGRPNGWEEIVRSGRRTHLDSPRAFPTVFEFLYTSDVFVLVQTLGTKWFWTLGTKWFWVLEVVGCFETGEVFKFCAEEDISL